MCISDSIAPAGSYPPAFRILTSSENVGHILRVIEHLSETSHLHSVSIMWLQGKASHLPPELWTRILEYATYVPGLYDVDVLDPFNCPNSQTPDDSFLKTDLASALKTKLSLPLVCRRWYAFAMPLLYRCIVVGSKQGLHAVIDTLMASKQRTTTQSDPSSSLGCCTHLVTIAVDDRVYSQDLRVEPLVQLIQCLPNLKILLISILHRSRRIGEPLPDHVMKALFETCGPSLQKVHFRKAIPSRQQSGVLTLCAPHLRTVIYGNEESYISFEDYCPVNLPRAPNLSFMTLTTRRSCHIIHDYHEHFPSVKQALFRTSRFLPSIDSWMHFLTMQGPLLTTVYLDLIGPRAASYVQPFMDALEIRCPHLIHLVIYLTDCWDLSPWSSISVTHLGVHCSQQDPITTANYPQLFTSILNLHAPALKVVRLLNPDSRSIQLMLRSPPQNTDAIHRRSRTLQFEDHEGKTLSLTSQ